MRPSPEDAGFTPKPAAEPARATAATSTATVTAEGPARTPSARPDPRRAPKPRQARVVLKKLSPWSVLKVSLFFYTCIAGVLLLALVILYAIVGAMGSLDALTRLAQDLFGDETFQIHGSWIFVRLLVTGGVMVVVWSLVNVFVVFLYNLISDVVGGIEITLSQRG